MQASIQAASLLKRRLKPGAKGILLGAKVWSTLVLSTFLVYYLCGRRGSGFYDYTFRIAGALLQGRLGLTQAPPSWLNEMVPVGDRYYSVFPLGSVLTMIPVALLQIFHVVDEFPAAFVSALCGALIVLFSFLLCVRNQHRLPRRAFLSLFLVFGTCTWCNLSFTGAWQIALGFAVLGELGVLYFSLVRPRPVLAGLFFAMAFGNRTEVMLTAPIFLYFLARGGAPPPTVPGERSKRSPKGAATVPGKTKIRASSLLLARRHVPMAAQFLAIPFVLGVLTLAYNYARFSSFSDFGYARIPGVLEESWYRHGIFSLYAIPLNLKSMIWEGWKRIDSYPYLVPTGFGGSIFLSSPYLFLLWRRGARDPGVKRAAWMAIGLLTFLLWCHGNPGGWQYSYRYAMILLPWSLVIFTENSPDKISRLEGILFSVSLIVNAYATYLFLWTKYVTP